MARRVTEIGAAMGVDRGSPRLRAPRGAPSVLRTVARHSVGENLYVLSNEGTPPAARGAGEGPEVLVIHAHGLYFGRDERFVTLPDSPRWLFQAAKSRAADQEELEAVILPALHEDQGAFQADETNWAKGKTDRYNKASKTVPDYILYKYRDIGAAEDLKGVALTGALESLVRRYEGRFDILIPRSRKAARMQIAPSADRHPNPKVLETGVVRFSDVIRAIREWPSYKLIYCSFCRVDLDDHLTAGQWPHQRP